MGRVLLGELVLMITSYTSHYSNVCPRFSICCTTLQEKLDPGVNWPLCMRVFLPLEAAGPMLTAIGFEGVKVDTSDSKMTLEVNDINFQILGFSTSLNHIKMLKTQPKSHKGGWR